MPTSTLPASAYEALELPTDTITVSTKPKPTQTPTSSIASLNLLQHEPAPAPPLAPNESAITLYVESLLHIRTVTLYASLHTSHTRETKAQLAADGGSITVSHEGESATVRLPIKAQGGGDATLLLPPQPPSKDLTLRLQIEEVEGMNFLGGAQAERKVNVVPWDGVSLNTMQEVEFVCRACERVLLKKGTIREWRDLPNENWAEMMDFWHCHKPDEHHLYGHNHAAQKSYAAGNRLQAIAGIGFVDLASLLLKEQDCEGVQLLSAEKEPNDQSITCKACTTILGILDPNTSGYRVSKHSIALATRSSSKPITFSPQKWLSARLLSLIENTGLRKFHLHPTSLRSVLPPAPVPSLLLWVFTPDLIFSSSKGRSEPVRAIKVFYQRREWAPLGPGDAEEASVEDVELEVRLYEELKRALEQNKEVLPMSARKFRGWDVGLLERFDIEEASVDAEGWG